MSDIAIRVQNLSKQYTIGKREGYKTLRDTVADAVTVPFRHLMPNGNPSSNGNQQGNGERDTKFWALKDVSFEVKRGEVVGVIGRNGAGKSTLLKILSRITEPTEGHVQIQGRVASLLEVGTGFHQELTGRENIYLNGAILGMKRSEIQRKFDEIVAFSEVEKFIDTPVKHYSSGMYLRLAFAVAAHLEPEILLVDEVLAVGDAAFQKKCLGKMGEVAKEGRTIIFVSHDLTAIQMLCSVVIRFEGGSLKSIGTPWTQIASYSRDANKDVLAQFRGPLALATSLSLLEFNAVPNPVTSSSPVIFSLEISAIHDVSIEGLALLILDSLNRRVGIIDLRQGEIVFRVNREANLRINANLKSFPMVEGEYRIGLWVQSSETIGNFYDLIVLSVMADTSAKEILPYPAVSRGIVEYNFTVHQTSIR